MMRGILVALSMTLAAQASAQNFSCHIGTRPACLDFGDTICSSMGRCVNANTVCFDNFQCNFEGFTCRSNVTACIEEFDDLQRRHNNLVRDYNELLQETQRLRFEEEAAEHCVQWATTLVEAQSCY